MLNKHPVRSFLSLAGIVIFAMLATGSKDDPPAYYPPPAPEEVGKQSAMGWARGNSAALASKLQQVEEARSEAQDEVQRLESLKLQFPEQASKIAASISDWQQVIIKLDSALTIVRQKISDAYVASQVGSDAGTDLLGKLSSDWGPTADAALREARKQRRRSSDSE